MSYTLNIHCTGILSVRSFVRVSVSQSVGSSIGPFVGPSAGSSAGWMHVSASQTCFYFETRS